MEDLKDVVDTMMEAGVSPEAICKYINKELGREAGDTFMARGILREASKYVKEEALLNPKCGELAMTYLTAIIQSITQVPEGLTNDEEGVALAGLVIAVTNEVIDQMNTIVGDV